MSKLFVDQVDPKTATTLTLGTSGDTVTVPSGAELKSNKISPASSTALQIGDSGDTITIPAGATLVNSGTATGFGGNSTPAFQATMSGNVDVSDNTWTKVPANTETYDTDGKYDNSSNYRFTPGEAGKYFIYGMVQANQKLSSYKWEASNIAIYKNGSEYLVDSFIDLRQGGADGGSVNISVVVDMDSDDYVELFAKPRSLNDEQCEFGAGSTLFGGYKLVGV